MKPYRPFLKPYLFVIQRQNKTSWICDDKHRGKQNIIYVNRNGVLVYWSTLRIQLFNCKSQLPVHTCKSYPHSKHTEAWFRKPWKLKKSILFLKKNKTLVSKCFCNRKTVIQQWTIILLNNMRRTHHVESHKYCYLNSYSIFILFWSNQK